MGKIEISLSKIQEMADEYTEQKAEQLFEQTVAEAPFLTGFLSQNIVLERTGTSKYVVNSMADYTMAVHEGHYVRGAQKGDAALEARIAKGTGGDGPKQVPENPFMQRAIDSMASE
jgi:hypothetical protein